MKRTVRVLNRFRLYTVVNILGLALSLACVILIARYVHQETTVNHFVTDLDRTYLMTQEEQNGQWNYSGARNWGGDPNFLNPLQHEAVERFSEFITYEEDHISLGEHRYNVKLIVTDTNFLKILPYPIIQGQPFSGAPDETILTREMARKLFGNENPVGKTLAFSAGDILKVVGVVGDPASKSFLEFDMLVNIYLTEHWARIPYNIVMLYPGKDVKHVNEAHKEFKSSSWGRYTRYQLAPLKDFYFGNSQYWVNHPIFIHGNLDSVKILSIVAFLILFVGIFNFVNIYTVMTLRRGREFGVKKVYGAGRWRIGYQIILENLMMVIAALFFAWFFIEMGEVVLTEKLAFSVRPNLPFDIALSSCILIVLPLVASFYPFLRYTRSAPVISLRSVNTGGVSVVSRRVFLFLQYVITFGLLIVALFFVKQLHFMLNSEPGYKAESVIVCKMTVQKNNHIHRGEDDLKSKLARVEKKMDESPLFIEWTWGTPLYGLSASTRVRRSDQEEYLKVAVEYLSPDYMDMFGLRLIEGRSWDSTDVWAQYKCIINESAKELFGITDIHSQQLQPENRWWISVGVDEGLNPPYEIVGVIEDFNTGHLSRSTVPLMVSFTEGDGVWDFLMARFVPGRQEEAMAYLTDLYNEINDSREFTYSLLEDDIARLYEEDRQVANVYVLFSLLAICISSMGLFALSLFDIRQRYREIALRKVNGAVSKEINRLLLKKYLRLLTTAFVVVIPVSLVVIHEYLEGFAHKATVTWWLFVIAGVVVVSISLLTLVWEVRKAMGINPSNMLQGE